MQPSTEKKPLLKKKPVKKSAGKSLKALYDESTGFSKFDPITGEKIAEVEGEDKEASQSGKHLANMEMSSEARKGRSAPNSPEETLKDAATGGSLSFLIGNSMLKGGGRKKGLVGIAGAVGSGLVSAKKQMSEYNKQQAARESISGKETGRSKAYKKMINKKYDTK